MLFRPADFYFTLSPKLFTDQSILQFFFYPLIINLLTFNHLLKPETSFSCETLHSNSRNLAEMIREDFDCVTLSHHHSFCVTGYNWRNTLNISLTSGKPVLLLITYQIYCACLLNKLSLRHSKSFLMINLSSYQSIFHLMNNICK